MQGMQLRRMARVAARLLVTAAIALGGTTASILGAIDFLNDAPLATRTIKPGDSFLFAGGERLVGKSPVPQYMLLTNNTKQPETIQFRKTSSGRVLAAFGVGTGGMLLSMGGAIGAAALTGRRRNAATLT